MSIDNLTLGELERLARMLDSVHADSSRADAGMAEGPQRGQYVIVRAIGAGVHAGILVGVDRAHKAVLLRDSRRLWRWWSRLSLSELASEGVRAGKEAECKFSAPSPETVEIATWCEIRPCSDAAEGSIRGVPNANA